MSKQPGLERLVRNFPKTKILVIGDIMVDRFIWGKVSRISPEAPVPVLVVGEETFLFGGAANVVNNIHAMGGEGVLCGVLGDDEMGHKLLERLTASGLKRQGVFVESGRQTTVKTRVIAHHQQVVRIDRETVDALKPSTLKGVREFIVGHLSEFDGVILSDYAKGVLTKDLIHFVIRRARQEEKFVMVDPKLNNFLFYRGATVVTPNTAEASAAAGIPIVDERSLHRVGQLILRRLKCDALVVTRGEEGMEIFEPRREPFHVSTVAQEVFDVTGAGDTVIGAMAVALAAGANVRDAARLANFAAGVVVGKVGTATAGSEELVHAIRTGR